MQVIEKKNIQTAKPSKIVEETCVLYAKKKELMKRINYYMTYTEVDSSVYC